MKARLGVLFLLPCVAGCGLPKASTVPIVAGTPANPALYEQYRLTQDIGVFSAKWTRADGEYFWMQINELAGQFPESADVYHRAEVRHQVLGVISGIGGGVVGFTLGWSLGANDQTRMSTGTQVALYSIGGGLILTSVIAGLAWHNPAEEFADVYNQSLRRHLGLPEPATRPQARLNGWMPEPIGESGFGWKF